MADKSKIEWTDASWTPIRARNLATGKIGWHCEHATTGCEFCYAEGMNRRLGTGLQFKPGHRKDVGIFLEEKMLLAPLRWKGPRMVFVCSMTDLFADFVQEEWIDRIFAVMVLCPQHVFQCLTKRPARMRRYCSDPGVTHRIAQAMDATLVDQDHDLTWPLPNCWFGVSAERQQEADERIALLLDTPAAVTFVSAEPLLGPIDLTQCGAVTRQTPGMEPAGCIDWVIVGGESGPRARPMHLQWARDLRDQCKAAGVPYFFKQMAKKAPIPDDLMIRQFPLI